MSNTPILGQIYKGWVEAKNNNLNPDYLIISKAIAKKLHYELGQEITDSALLYGMKVRISGYASSAVYHDSTNNPFTLDHLMTTSDNTCYGNDSYDVIEHELVGVEL